MKGWTTMMDTRKQRIAVFLFFLLAFLTALFFCKQAEQQRCLDVRILSESEQENLGRYAYRDLSWELLYNGQRAAVDLRSDTVYIAQDIRQGTKKEDLLGSLQTKSPSLRLSFAPDEAFEELALAVESGHVFQLNVGYGSDKYMQYNVVFTTLPVLRLDGEFLSKNEKGKDINQGDMCLWTPYDPDTGRYSVKTSDALWHVRGGLSAMMNKTPFKLELKKKSGENKNLALTGLGADDDWLLNPMNLDDTKLKEKLFCRLWNENTAQLGWNEQMSEGQYLEVVINQKYKGLYQLQRRVDNKFLALQTDDILLKSGSVLDASTIQEAYEIVYSGLTAEETYDVVRDFYNGKDKELLDLDNFVDVSLFLQYASAGDNYSKNMFYVLRKNDAGYGMTLLPWDTDMSWGVVWDDYDLVMDPEASRQHLVYRKEYGWISQFYPDLAQRMADRWFQLRQDLLTMENMTAILEEGQQILRTSGAQQRDQDCWGLFYGGEDSLENLYQTLEDNLSWLDDYYGQQLQ